MTKSLTQLADEYEDGAIHDYLLGKSGYSPRAGFLAGAKCALEHEVIRDMRDALQELVSQHMREHNGESKVYGHLVKFGSESLAAFDALLKEME